MKFAPLRLFFFSSLLGRHSSFQQRCRFVHVKKGMAFFGSSSDATAATPLKTFEVEQKFAITAQDVGTTVDLRDRLIRAGLVESNSKEMVDWYFDVPSNDYPLIRQDCWLRYRSSTSSSSSSSLKGQWELKRGTIRDTKSNSKATVYEEIEGEQALLQARELIETFQARQNTSDGAKHDAPNLYQQHEIPQSPIEITSLAPLARIATQRSTWRSAKQTDKLFVVDLDSTDFQYAVGEVETVVTDQSQIEAAQEELQQWLRNVLGETALQGPPPMGKLEYYLSTQRPEILEILVEAGLMPNRNN